MLPTTSSFLQYRLSTSICTFLFWVLLLFYTSV